MAANAIAGPSSSNTTSSSTGQTGVQDPGTPRPGLLLVIDLAHLTQRVFVANRAAPLRVSASGQPTTITYAFMKELRVMLQAERPTALAVVYNRSGDASWRHALSLLDPTAAGGAADETATAAAAAAAERRQAAIAGGELDLTRLAEQLLTKLVGAREDGSGGVPQEAGLETARSALQELLGGPEAAARLGLLPDAQPTYKGSALVPPPGLGPSPADFAQDLDADVANLYRLLRELRVPLLQRPLLEAKDLAGLLAAQVRGADGGGGGEQDGEAGLRLLLLSSRLCCVCGVVDEPIRPTPPACGPHAPPPTHTFPCPLPPLTRGA